MNMLLEELFREKIRPYLISHGGDGEIVESTPSKLVLRMAGNCAGCPSADLYTKRWMERILEECLGKKIEVELEHTIDEEMLSFARKLLAQSA
ncbi:MAG: NifU family protein [Lachnospiraceae bacterium]|nr:NifU family protein [Lachnospiraceae bacterium]